MGKGKVAPAPVIDCAFAVGDIKYKDAAMTAKIFFMYFPL
jgi:hypothetical protein